MTRSTENRALLRQLAVSVSIVAAIWVAAVTRWIAKDAVIPWDSKNQFYAFFRFLSETLNSGEWPFWNPYHYGGHPSVADPQSLIFSPLFVVWGALDRLPTMRAFDIAVQAHLLVGGLAVACIGWRARWPAASCVLAATLFMLGGPASGRLQHSGIILSYSAFPLALLLLQLALERRSYLLALAFSVIAAMMALGRNQVALLLCALLVSAAVTEVASSQQPVRYLRKRAGVLTLMALAGAALLVVPLLLTMQFAALSNRPTEVLDEALRGSLYPANFATIAIPDIFGTHSAYWGPGAATLAEVDLTDDSENYLFLGAVPPLLLLWFGVAGCGLWQPGRRLIACALLASCLFMLGRYTPFYSLGFRFIPGIDLFRRPTDGSFVFTAAFAFIVGHCLADYVRYGLPKLRTLGALFAVVTSFAVIWSAIAFSARTGHALDALRQTLVSVLVMASAGLLLFALRREGTRVLAAAFVTLAAVAELMWWNTASRLNAEPRNLYSVLEVPSGPEAVAITTLERSIAADHRRGDYPRVEVLGLGGPWQNLAMVRGWEAINGYNPLRIGLYDRLVSPGEQNWNVSQRQFPPSFKNYDCSLAKALGLTYLVLGSPLPSLPALPSLPSSELLLSGPPVWIYRLPGALPRVTLVTNVTLEQPRLDRAPRSGDGSNEVQPSGIGPTAAVTADASSGVATIASSAPGRLDVVTTTTIAGFLLVHDPYYPGWFAKVDGKKTPIVRAEQLFGAVEVPAGMHQVSFYFAPFALENLGAALQILFGHRPSGLGQSTNACPFRSG